MTRSAAGGPNGGVDRLIRDEGLSRCAGLASTDLSHAVKGREDACECGTPLSSAAQADQHGIVGEALLALAGYLDRSP
ncbi:MAG: hypothetical protein HONBIEJF_02239 [Fimbriimonadaceae bacterium]|nr:hypothetical protein [Fimbriimonadaceae bacterium]